MQVRLHDDAATLLAVAGRLLRADPFSTSVIATVSARVAAGGGPDGHDRLWATIAGADGELVGVAMHTPPFPLFVSRMPPQAAGALADALTNANRQLAGVSGARDAATAFAEAWCRRTGLRSRLRTAMRMYRLDTLRHPDTVPGVPALARAPADIELVAGWFEAFHREAQPQAPSDNTSPALIEHRIAAEEIHLWRHAGQPVSLAAVSAPAAGVARVGPVYTPAHLRRKGYGAAITATATAAAITAGAEHVVLYTDLANSTSNSIYQAIGFRPDHDAQQLTFD
jgi:GNAT superfamily N-acetyltransferase